MEGASTSPRTILDSGQARAHQPWTFLAHVQDTTSVAHTDLEPTHASTYDLSLLQNSQSIWNVDTSSYFTLLEGSPR